MKGKTKKVEDVEESVKKARAEQTTLSNDELVELNSAKDPYVLKNKIKNSSFLKSGNTGRAATSWLFKEVLKSPRKYKHNTTLLDQGHLFMFKYFNPKYKDTSVLPFFDKYPLVLSLGPFISSLGPRNIGFNLHLLPPKIRIITICYVFEIFKRLYKQSLYFKKGKQPVMVNYKLILKSLQKFGVEFAVRMYIPNRMNEIVHFPINEWHKAIFIPSRGYYDIRAKALIKEWKKFCKDKGLSVNENVNWRSLI